MKPALKITLLICGILLSISGFSQSNPIHLSISVHQADTLIKDYADSSNFIIMDVRTSGEYEAGYIEGAINVDYYADEFDGNLALLDKTKVFLIYCGSGGRSGAVFNKMKALEFEVVYNMLGGIAAWKNAGLPLVISTGIDNIIANENIRIYPNPANNYFNLELANPEMISSFSILDTRGRPVHNSVSSGLNANSQINTSEWASGLYLLRIIGRDGFVQHKKILVN